MTSIRTGSRTSAEHGGARRLAPRISALAISAALLAIGPAAAAGDGATRRFDLELGLESRTFFERALEPQREPEEVSLRFEPEISIEWDRRAGFVFRPFARLDSADAERSHADVRELYAWRRLGAWSLRAGVRQVFWGATESVHLVDIVNQTDLVENLDTEDKLGQPMLQVARSAPHGSLELSVLPLFRERTFPGRDGRLRAPLPVDTGGARFESSRGRSHLDWAARYSGRFGPLDVGLSHFSGTAREPRLVPVLERGSLTPFYPLIDQTGVDATAALGRWLWKLEAIRNRSRAGLYHAAAGGFELTLSGAFGTPMDLGLLAELLWDERGRSGPSPFQDDLFLGTRLGFNDVATTEVLAGVIVDLEDGGTLFNLEASRRIGRRYKAIAELRLFDRTAPGDALHLLRRDDYLSLELVFYP